MLMASVISARTAADGPSLSFFNQSICSGESHTLTLVVFRGGFSSGLFDLLAMAFSLANFVLLFHYGR